MSNSVSWLAASIFSAGLFFHSFADGQQISLVDDLEAVIKKKQEKASKFVPSIQLDKGMSERNRLVWQLYATMRRMYLDDKYPDRKGEVIPSFKEEVFARKKWYNTHLKPLRSRFKAEFGSYLDGLSKTLDNQFIREYVWTFHRREQWEKPDGLKLDEFEKFKKQELKNHKPQTKAKLVMMPPAPARGIRILLDKKAMESETDGAILMHYALMRFDYMRKNLIRPKVNINELIIPSFEEEVFARQKFADDSQKHLSADPADSLKTFILELAEVRKAKWMREYVWTHHRQSKWDKPAELKLDEFKQWSADHLKEHKPIQGAALVGL